MSEATRILSRPELKPYWAAVAKIHKKYYQLLRNTRDGSYTYALDALDEIEAIPRNLDKNKVDDETST